jgi:hypothetical protein
VRSSAGTMLITGKGKGSAPQARSASQKATDWAIGRVTTMRLPASDDGEEGFTDAATELEDSGTLASHGLEDFHSACLQELLRQAFTDLRGFLGRPAGAFFDVPQAVHGADARFH